MAYHKVEIKKGIVGEISKIQEELDELKDVEDQNAKILMLCELSDIIAAVDCYLVKRFNHITLDDLVMMAKSTRSAYEDGSRK